MAFSRQKMLKMCTLPLIRKYSSEKKLVDTIVNDNTGIAVVTMQRLPVNSLNLDLITELSSTIDQLEINKSRGLILTSVSVGTINYIFVIILMQVYMTQASSSVFSAGLDIMEMYKPDINRVTQFWSKLQDLWIKLYGCSFPSAAAINVRVETIFLAIFCICCKLEKVTKFTISKS